MLRIGLHAIDTIAKKNNAIFSYALLIATDYFLSHYYAQVWQVDRCFSHSADENTT
jgi:hypothetical protein